MNESERGRGLSRSRHSRMLTVTGVMAITFSQAACYTYSAAPQGEKVPGARYAFTLTDRGRAELAEQIGPGVLQVEGRLVQNDNAAYTVSVAAVRAIDGRRRWAGERIAIAHDFVANTLERRFSRKRTIIATSAVVGGVVLFAVTRDLNVFGLGRDNPRPPQGPID
jgi:hypothetical protein